ncbi:MAG: DUF58 domain-containing protein [Pirellulaceae bacterium]
MATVETVSSSNDAPKSGFGPLQLWNSWVDYRKRMRSRNLAQVRFRLTREGVHFVGILAFIFIGAVIREISLLILLAGAMIGLLLLQWRFNSSTLVGVHLIRRQPKSVAVGEELEVGLRLVNPKLFLSAWLVLVEDSLRKIGPNRERVSEQGVALVDTVRPLGATQSRYRLNFFERGKYEIGPARVSTRFPLGLGVGWKTVDTTCSVLVHPAQGSVKPAIKGLFHLDEVGAAKSSARAALQEGDFFGLRPWATGDSKRWVHWRTSARLGQLSVRQFEQQQQKQVTVLLDLAEMDADGGRLSCEAAISFLATLASHTLRHGREKLAVAIAGREVACFPAIPSSVMVNNLLDSLAFAETSSEPDLMAAMRGLSIPISNNPRVLVVSTRQDQSEALLSASNEGLDQRLLSAVRLRWLNVAAGDLEKYFDPPDFEDLIRAKSGATPVKS